MLHNIFSLQKKYGKFETKKAFYDCKICDSKVKHTKSGIQKHLSHEHDGMKIFKYEEVFHPKTDQGDVKTNGSLTMAKNSSGNTSTVKLNSDEIFKNWAKGTCTFRCNICSFEEKGSVEFWKHVKYQHDMEIQAYKESYDNPCIVMNKITCKLCSKVLRYDYGTLLGHASTRHNMKLIDFYEKFYKNEAEALEKKFSTENLKVDSNFNFDSEKNGESSNSILYGGRYIAMDDLGKRTQSWAWKCRYKCAICNQQAR